MNRLTESPARDKQGEGVWAPQRHRHGASQTLVCLLATAMLALSVAGCGKREDSTAAIKPASPAASTPRAASARTYAYGDWSAWQLDCAKRAAEPHLPCAAVRKRVCQIEGTQEGVACEHCGGQCREEVADDKSTPLHFYAAWSGWQSGCNACDAEPKPCKAERSRLCLDRVAGKATDCEFCGGACKEQEERMSGCAPECKWTRVHAYADQACTIEIRGDIFAGQWGPQTNSPFNAGCSETLWTDKCVQFGKNYYKWEPCTRGCSPPGKM